MALWKCDFTEGGHVDFNYDPQEHAWTQELLFSVCRLRKNQPDVIISQLLMKF